MADVIGRERLAVLEERAVNQSAQIETIASSLNQLDGKIERILERLDRSAGFFSGVAFAFGLIGAFIGTFGTELYKKIAIGG